LRRLTAKFLAIGAALAIAAGVPANAFAAEEVDLELVLAADGSGSIDDEELRLQREGYARAVAHPSVQSAIKSGFLGKIAIAYIEWGRRNRSTRSSTGRLSTGRIRQPNSAAS